MPASRFTDADAWFMPGTVRSAMVAPGLAKFWNSAWVARWSRYVAWFWTRWSPVPAMIESPITMMRRGVVTTIARAVPAGSSAPRAQTDPRLESLIRFPPLRNPVRAVYLADRHATWPWLPPSRPRAERRQETNEPAAGRTVA